MAADNKAGRVSKKKTKAAAVATAAAGLASTGTAGSSFSSSSSAAAGLSATSTAAGPSASGKKRKRKKRKPAQKKCVNPGCTKKLEVTKLADQWVQCGNTNTCKMFFYCSTQDCVNSLTQHRAVCGTGALGTPTGSLRARLSAAPRAAAAHLGDARALEASQHAEAPQAPSTRP
ncbi:hypothetical protein B484DRAFT_411596 [Ochromonadaceae sp. CCMP2298]|nr:hypothetical protein B484DRAFT_411596 [Ochromonadaceae sp. CCMP2298]